MIRVGIDIGGTFTDLVLIDDASGRRVIHKRPSTPDDPARAGLEGVRELCAKAEVEPKDIKLLVHGTTVATNTLLERKGARVAAITTRGFRDILHIGRKNRPLNFSHSQDVARQSSPLVLRRHRKVVTERVTAPAGEVATALDEQEVRDAIRELREDGSVEAIAICCLFSFLNPSHEARIQEIVKEEWPEVFVCSSHQVVPLYREYERFSTTALNAYVGPRTARYIERFSCELQASGCGADLGLMTSAGGVISADEAASSPVSLLLSGPVGALVAGIETGQQCRLPSVITLDVGGTSADIGVAPDGELRMKHLLDTQIGGYDAMVPMCDIGTIGAGGGSIAWIDDGGMFRVGPHSAGAVPGPASYCKGGELPTVTDAMVAMGWYRPDALQESGLSISTDAALQAIEEHVALPLKLPILAAAAGIFRIAVNNMAEAIRVNSVAKGLDPREFALVAYGGAGAAFAVAVARELAISTVLVPPAAGVGAAGGLLATNMKYDRQATLWQNLNTPETGRIEAVLASLEAEARSRLQRDGFSAADATVRFSADCRYKGQGYELRVPVPQPPVNEEWCRTVTERFHKAHEAAYARRFTDRDVMIVNLGATGEGKIAAIPPQPYSASMEPGAPVQGEMSFPTETGFSTEVGQFLERSALLPQQVINGPAVIEQSDTTTVLPPGASLTVGEFGHLIINCRQQAQEND